MKYRLIAQGDTTTTGGVVLEGISTVKTNHRPITLRGMSASCPACQQGIGTITPSLEHKINVEYGKAAIEGDIVACGCPYGSNTVIAASDTMEFLGTEEGSYVFSLNNLFAEKNEIEIEIRKTPDSPLETLTIQKSKSP